MEKNLNIYTRTGDNGMTSLVGGVRVSKRDIRLEAYGTVDELNSHLGLLLTYLKDKNKDQVFAIQNKLFSVASYLATDQSKIKLRKQSVLTEDDSKELENAIDELQAQLPHIEHFILPGGCQASAQCHICRTICRRAERRIIVLTEEIKIDPNLLKYMNRLSDYLFVLARKLNFLYNVEEIYWQRSCK